MIKRPIHFDFHPGDYIFVNIPAIAKYEWHPFTISSAPEQEEYMWLHIRGVGHWTNRLYEYFEREQQKLHNGEIPPYAPSPQLQSKIIPHNNVENNNQNPLKKMHATITRTFSGREILRKPGVQLVGFTNDAMQLDEHPKSQSNNDSNGIQASCSLEMETKQRKLSPDKKLQKLLFANSKAPLEKSLSMPDIQTKAKKRERLLV